jgi:hypothetical protein
MFKNQSRKPITSPRKLEENERSEDILFMSEFQNLNWKSLKQYSRAGKLKVKKDRRTASRNSWRNFTSAKESAVAS